MRRFEPRKRQRIPNVDYSHTNTYFITVTTHQQIARFGTVHNATVELNDAGRTVDRFWRLIPTRHRSVQLDAFVVMPDHFHGLLVLTGQTNDHPSLPRIMQWFKTWTTNEYATGVTEMGWAPFEGKLWHTGYYDHICQSEDDIERIRAYIRENPARRWQKMQIQSVDAPERTPAWEKRS